MEKSLKDTISTLEKRNKQLETKIVLLVSEFDEQKNALLEIVKKKDEELSELRNMNLRLIENSLVWTLVAAAKHCNPTPCNAGRHKRNSNKEKKQDSCTTLEKGCYTTVREESSTENHPAQDSRSGRRKVNLTVEEDSGEGDKVSDPLSQLDNEQMLRLTKALASEQAKQMLGENGTAMLDMLSVEENSTAFLQQSIRFDHCYTNLTANKDPKGPSLVQFNDSSPKNATNSRGRLKARPPKNADSSTGPSVSQQQTKKAVGSPLKSIDSQPAGSDTEDAKEHCCNYPEFIHNYDVYGKMADFVTARLLPRFVKCQRCGNQLKMQNTKEHFQCGRHIVVDGTKQKCLWTASARKGTFFEGSKLSYKKIMEIVTYFLLIRRPRINYAASHTSLSKATIIQWEYSCREVCINWAIRNSQKLGGPGQVVEIDEAQFGSKKFNRGPRIDGEWVFGGIERDSKKCFLVPVATRDSQTLLAVIRDYILPGSTIVSDCWKAYDCLASEGFQHFRVNHDINFVDPADQAVHTENNEQIYTDVYVSTPRFGRKSVQLVGYLAEFMFKRANQGDIFNTFVDEIKELFPGL